MIKKLFLFLYFFTLVSNCSKVLASDSCDLEKCRQDCNEIGMPLRSCKYPVCIPVCGPLDEPTEVFPVIVPSDTVEKLM